MLDAIGERQDVFLSTPSARRATRKRILSPSWGEFLSTPSARRATADLLAAKQATEISIHALREEGDQSAKDKRSKSWEFLSTPSARRATSAARSGLPRVLYFYPRPPRGGRPEYLGDLRVIKEISIHALREEGDEFIDFILEALSNFYPRPPRGGRRYANQ